MEGGGVASAGELVLPRESQSSSPSDSSSAVLSNLTVKKEESAALLSSLSAKDTLYFLQVFDLLPLLRL